MLRKVISGGQTGADMGAVLAARDHGLETGGWMPKGWKIEGGHRSSEEATFYGFQEHESPRYADRTRDNVRDADLTLMVASDWDSPGTGRTMAELNALGKPCFIIDRRNPQPHVVVAGWLREAGCEVLNVAGNRESRSPGMQAWLRGYLGEVFRLLKEGE